MFGNVNHTKSINFDATKQVIIVLLLLGLSACEAIQGSPNRAINADTELASLKVYFEPAIIKEYDDESDVEAKRLKRNEIVNGRLAYFDINFNQFKRAIYSEGVLANIGVDITTIGLGAAGR